MKCVRIKAAKTENSEQKVYVALWIFYDTIMLKSAWCLWLKSAAQPSLNCLTVKWVGEITILLTSTFRIPGQFSVNSENGNDHMDLYAHLGSSGPKTSDLKWCCVAGEVAGQGGPCCKPQSCRLPFHALSWTVSSVFSCPCLEGEIRIGRLTETLARINLQLGQFSYFWQLGTLVCFFEIKQY